MALRRARRPRGRRSPPREHTGLIRALIQRQDSLSRRRHAQIAQILGATVPREDVQRRARQLVAQVAAAVADLPARYVARCPGLVNPDAVASLLRAEFRGIVAELAEGLGVAAAAGATLECDGLKISVEEPPRLTPSASLVAARTQAANLQSFLSDLRERIKPFAPLNGSPMNTSNGCSPRPRDRF